jgi:Histidine phosphatase superfamily (branch 1)
MSRGRRALAVLVAIVCTVAAAAPVAWAQPSGDWSRLVDGVVVLFRHANAPGTGDPPNFKLDDCGTQRNLDEAGRAQARRIGEQFRAHGVIVGAVLTSQWCRAQDTAELAFPGQRRDEPAFNSFFGRPDQRERQIREATALILRWRGPGVMVVTTHQVNVTALTRIDPVSGEGVIVRGTPNGIDVLGRLSP